MTPRVVTLLIGLAIVASTAAAISCSVTIESGEVQAFHHRPAAADSDTPTPWPTPTPTARG